MICFKRSASKPRPKNINDITDSPDPTPTKVLIWNIKPIMTEAIEMPIDTQNNSKNNLKGL